MKELSAYMAVLMTPKKSSLTVPMQNCNQQCMAEQCFRLIGLKQRVAGAVQRTEQHTPCSSANVLACNHVPLSF